MRGKSRALLIGALLSACGPNPAPVDDTERAAEPWPLDGFLQYLPKDLSITLRLPRGDTAGAKALLEMLGRPGQILVADGLDPSRAQGLAVTTTGAWVRYLPATDKATLNQALKDTAHKVAHREEANWIILSKGGKGAGKSAGDPMPPGDAGVRLRFHPLLDAVFPTGDSVEAGLTLGSAGIDFSGRIRPGRDSPTIRRIAQAKPSDGGLIDMMPAWLPIRIETSLPATALAAVATREFCAHCGVDADKDRVLIERFLRELLTAVDPATGLGIGIDFSGGNLSFVLLGKVADGPPSPLLAGVRDRRRSSIGPLVLDLRHEAPKGSLGHYAWIVEAQPRVDGVPEIAWSMIGDLCGGEQGGLPVAYAEHSGWFVLGLGRRADRLVKAVHFRLRGNATGSAGSSALRQARQRRGKDDYVLGVVIHGAGFAGLAQADRALLMAALGATDDSQSPGVVAIAGLRRAGVAELMIEGRLLYGR